jgi:3,5-epimerase/4-reductase
MAEEVATTGGWLVYGSRGWIGGKICDILREQGQTLNVGQARIERMTEVEAELDKYKPEFVINAAGTTGRPNVDWCEDHQPETIRLVFVLN